MAAGEHAVEEYLHSRVLRIGGMTYKWVSPGHVGVPDRIVIYGGMVFFVEVKTAEGELSSTQRRALDRLKDMGMMTSVVYGKGAVDTFVNGIQIMKAEREGGMV